MLNLITKPSVNSITFIHHRPTFLFLFHRLFKSNYDRGFSRNTYNHVNKKEELFQKILIANRGEIACRVAKTCKKLGIKTASIYSVADSQAVHALSCDEAYCVGPAQTSLSYLNMESILKAVKDSGAQAVHPGYGFLSENTEFAEMLEENKITFIGPNSKAIRAMGDKILSKRIAKQAGVNIVPGFDGVVKSADECVQIAKSIGYPIIIKASAGGGGKGMRIARNDVEARKGFTFSSQEAESGFGDNRLIVEKFIENPRHIEIQVLCDKFGNAVYLNERECSIQRRNQKVIEEAPSTFINKSLREEMGEQAIKLAKAVHYDSAGTVEFLVDSNKKFYFLEMNTRLQVEHPITECITGIDLVHEMIRVAKGHRLNITQNEVPLNGWAIEARVYAEDPFKNFGLPSIGRLKKYIEPNDIENIRCDSGVDEGSQISVYYDPMICKLISYGPDRKSAICTMIKALDSYVIRGVTHNISLLRDILTEKNFVEGNLSTNYLNQVYPDGFHGKKLTSQQYLYLCAFASVFFLKDYIQSHQILNMNPAHSSFETITSQKYWNLICIFKPTQCEKKSEIPIKISISKSHFIVHLGCGNLQVSKNISLVEPKLELNVNQEKIVVQLISNDSIGRIRLQYLGTIFDVQVMRDVTFEYSKLMPVLAEQDKSKMIKAPMPGVIRSIFCKVGEFVTEGEELCVIEAMKMQNGLSISSSGKVKAIHFKEGDTIEEAQTIIELE